MSMAPGANETALSIAAFSCPKAGNTADEYEDAWSVRRVESGDARIAVTDGATESSYAKTWAGLLAEAYTAGEVVGAEFLNDLETLRARWRETCLGRPLPWYAEEKAAFGAFAAFLGLSIEPASRSWSAFAVGDCCLFQLDALKPGLRVVEAFPLTRASDFGSNPYLIGTRVDDKDELVPHIRVAYGRLRPGDLVLVASDALSAWLLGREEEGEPAWRQVTEDVCTQADFEALVNDARQRGLRNDDTTLVRIVFNG